MQLNDVVTGIEQNLSAATQQLAQIDQALQFLTTQGMYPAAANEQWQTRKAGQSDYLYMTWPSDGNGGYTGPDGKRKLYVGKDEARIFEARRLNSNRIAYDRLVRRKRDLDWWIRGQKRALQTHTDKLQELLSDTATPPPAPELDPILENIPLKLPNI